MLYRSSDCILKQKAWKNIFIASRRKILGLRWKILASRWKILASWWKILASWWKILASWWKILGLRHTDRACFYFTQIAQISQIFFRTRIARITRMKARRHGYFTQIARISQIFFDFLYRHGFRLPAYDALRASGWQQLHGSMKKLESRFCGIKNFRTDFRKILSVAT